jgi:TPR repeat protein
MMKKTLRGVILLSGILLFQACVQLRNEAPARYCVGSEAFRVAMGLPSDEDLRKDGLIAVSGMEEGGPFYSGTQGICAVPDRMAIEKMAQGGNAWAQCAIGWFYDYAAIGAERNFFKAFDGYRAAARQGYVPAYGHLGWLYLHGEGVPKNTDLAKATFEKGAAAGSPPALSGLGFMYLYGVGVQTNYALARKLFEQGAAKGYAHSEYHIGLFHDWGYGCSVNRQEAKKWFLSAARKGYHKAQYALGNYLWTEGNKEEALSWFRLAARQGNLDAMVKLWRTLTDKSSPLCNLEEAFHWTLRLAEQGSPEGLLYASIMYYEGEGVKTNMAEAVRWLGMAKVLGSDAAFDESRNERPDGDDGMTPYQRYMVRPIDEAQLELGMAYGKGEGLKQDEMQALRWLTLAANNQNREAQRMLGASLFYGYCGVTNKTDGIRWLKLAVAQNDLIGMFHLGVIYLDETSDPEDDEEGLHWLHQAAKRGLPEAQFFLGRIYLVGKSFVTPDPILAEKWLLRSAEQKCPEATFLLAESYLRGSLNENLVKVQQALEMSALMGVSKHQLALGAFFLGDKNTEALGLYWLARAWVVGGNQDAKTVFLKNKALYEKYHIDVLYRLQEDAEAGDEEAKKVAEVLRDLFDPAKKNLKKSGTHFEKR